MNVNNPASLLAETKEIISKTNLSTLLDLVSRLETEYENELRLLSDSQNLLGNIERRKEKLTNRYVSILTHLASTAEIYLQLKTETANPESQKILMTKVNAIMQDYILIFWDTDKPWRNAFGIDCLSELSPTERQNWDDYLKNNLSALINEKS